MGIEYVNSKTCQGTDVEYIKAKTNSCMILAETVLEYYSAYCLQGKKDINVREQRTIALGLANVLTKEEIANLKDDDVFKNNVNDVLVKLYKHFLERKQIEGESAPSLMYKVFFKICILGLNISEGGFLSELKNCDCLPNMN